jgi:ATP-dependent DNA ligase
MGIVRPPIVFYVFDLLQLNGKDPRGLPIEERKAKLAALLKRPPADIRYSPSFTQNIDELLSRVREFSLEGLIGKRAGSKYDSNRSGAWIKIKLYQQGSFVIGGYTPVRRPSTSRPDCCRDPAWCSCERASDTSHFELVANSPATSDAIVSRTW